MVPDDPAIPPSGSELRVDDRATAPRRERLGLALPAIVLALAAGGAWFMGQACPNGGCPFSAVLGGASAERSTASATGAPLTVGDRASPPDSTRHPGDTMVDRHLLLNDLGGEIALSSPQPVRPESAAASALPGMGELAHEKLRRMEANAAAGADLDDTRDSKRIFTPDELAGAQRGEAPARAWRDVMPSDGQALTITERTQPFSFRIDAQQTPDGRIELANVSGAVYEVRIRGAAPGSVRVDGQVVADLSVPLALAEHLRIEAPAGTEVFVSPSSAVTPPGPNAGN